MSHKSLIFAILTIIASVGLAAAQSSSRQSYAVERALDEYRNGNNAAAIEWLDKELKANPQNGDAYLILTAIRYEAEQYGKALTTINNAIAYLPKRDKAMTAVAYGFKGDIMRALCDTVAATANYDQAIKLDPANVSLYISRGNLYFEQNNYKSSEKDFRQVTEMEPGNPIGYIGLAQNFMAQKNYDKAISTLTHAIRLDPEKSETYAFRAEAYLDQAKWAEAADDIIKAFSIGWNDKAFDQMTNIPDEALPTMKAKLLTQANKNSEQPIWYYFMGTLSLTKNNYREAIKYYTKVNEKKVDSGILEVIATCYFYLGDYSYALKQVDKAIDLKPADEDLYLLKGNIYNELGNRPAAIAQLDKYLEMVPDSFFGYYRRGWFRDGQGDRKGAIDDYSVSIALNPGYAYAYVGRGRNYDLLGQKDAAVADYNKAIELDSIPSKNSCAQYAYFFLGRPDKAEDFMKRYLENSDEKDLAGCNYDAACLYSLMGDVDKSLYHLREAFKNGWRRFAHLSVDRDLENIRHTQQFKDLVKEFHELQEKENVQPDSSDGQAFEL